MYSKNDMLVMEADIQNLKTHGADGFVFGCLQDSGKIEQVCAALTCFLHLATNNHESKFASIVRF